MTEVCPTTELEKVGCAHCRPKQPEPATDPLDVGPLFFARFDGRCADCGDPFEAGERIAKLLDGSGYVQEDCLA